MVALGDDLNQEKREMAAGQNKVSGNEGNLCGEWVGKHYFSAGYLECKPCILVGKLVLVPLKLVLK